MILEKDRMNMHRNARLIPRGRVDLVASGQIPASVTPAFGVCPRTVRKWVKRYEAEGLAGLQGRSSPPNRLHRPTSSLTLGRVEALRC